MKAHGSISSEVRITPWHLAVDNGSVWRCCHQAGFNFQCIFTSLQCFWPCCGRIARAWSPSSAHPLCSSIARAACTPCSYIHKNEGEYIQDLLGLFVACQIEQTHRDCTSQRSPEPYSPSKTVTARGVGHQVPLMDW